MVSHKLQQRGIAEAGDVKFSVEQRMGAAVMSLQEVRNWPGGQGVLSGFELYTDIDLDRIDSENSAIRQWSGLQEHRKRLAELRATLRQEAARDIRISLRRDIRRELNAKLRMVKG